MSTKPFDQFNKRLFQELLSPLGWVIPNLSVLGEERMIDVFFAPHPGAVLNADELGILAKMVDRPALLEPFRSAVTNADIETCLVKLFSLTAELKREHPTVTIEAPAHLWILAAEVSDRLLQEFTIGLDPEFGEGFYQTKKGFRTTIVAINELPPTPETLWLRLMGKGTLQESAIEELILLRDTDLKRANALNLLVSWRISIELTNQLESEEKRTLMALSQAYLEWEKQTRRQGLELGIVRGLEQGLERERRSTIINLMRLRYGVIDSALEKVIPRLMVMSNEDYTRVLLNLSKSELIEQLKS